jgi:hypothetical protein
MRAWIMSLALVACAAKPRWVAAAVSSKLHAAGYVISPAGNPGIAGPGIVAVDCVSASRSGATDVVCVVTCSSRAACASFAAGTWESYGTFQRGPTLLVHQVCGRPPGYPLSFDCTAVRSVLDP